MKIHGTAGEAAPPIAVIDVDPPALKRRHQIEVTVVIEIPHDEGTTRHRLSGSNLGKRRVEFPVPFPITEIDSTAAF